MALKIRLRQQGKTNRQTYRLVVTDIRCPRDGKYLEMLGWYNPFAAENNSHLHVERIQHWMGLGAKLTPSAETLLARVAPHFMEELRQKRQDKLLKKITKRRSSKKSAVAAKVAAPAKEPVAEKKPRAPRAKAAKK